MGMRINNPVIRAYLTDDTAKTVTVKAEQYNKFGKLLKTELLLGDYTEIEEWIKTGRVDVGFLRLPTTEEFENIFLEDDKLLVVLPENHPLAESDKFPVKALCDYPFMLLEKGAKAEISEIFERNNITPNVRFTTWDDYAVMSMVEGGLGIAILPKLILRRIPYKIIAKSALLFEIRKEYHLPLKSLLITWSTEIKTKIMER